MALTRTHRFEQFISIFYAIFTCFSCKNDEIMCLSSCFKNNNIIAIARFQQLKATASEKLKSHVCYSFFVFFTILSKNLSKTLSKTLYTQILNDRVKKQPSDYKRSHKVIMHAINSTMIITIREILWKNCWTSSLPIRGTVERIFSIKANIRRNLYSRIPGHRLKLIVPQRAFQSFVGFYVETAKCAVHIFAHKFAICVSLGVVRKLVDALQKIWTNGLSFVDDVRTLAVF